MSRAAVAVAVLALLCAATTSGKAFGRCQPRCTAQSRRSLPGFGTAAAGPCHPRAREPAARNPLQTHWPCASCSFGTSQTAWAVLLVPRQPALRCTTSGTRSTSAASAATGKHQLGLRRHVHTCHLHASGCDHARARSHAADPGRCAARTATQDRPAERRPALRPQGG